MIERRTVKLIDVAGTYLRMFLTGNNVREERKKQSAVKLGPSPPALAKCLHYGPSNGSSQQVRPTTPRQPTPLANKKVNNKIRRL